jgi:hypothetical protein
MNDAPRDLETVSVTLEEGVHFVGRIEGFSIDTVAEESVGGRGEAFAGSSRPISQIWPKK